MITVLLALYVLMWLALTLTLIASFLIVADREVLLILIICAFCIAVGFFWPLYLAAILTVYIKEKAS